jgi:hypothetical protein
MQLSNWKNFKMDFGQLSFDDHEQIVFATARYRFKSNYW